MKEDRKKPKNRRIFLALLSLLAIYILWLAIQTVGFKTYSLRDKSVSPLWVKGAYHIHTTFSDGQKTPVEIARIASRLELDFIILTDHGEPNRESMAAAGWMDNLLVLAGSELSVNRGHLVALGFEPPSSSFSREAELADHQIKSLGGFSIIAHPYSKISWSWGKANDYSGLEIIDFNTMLKDNLIRIAPIFPLLAIKPDYALLKMLRRPAKPLKKWDELNSLHPTYGFFSVDAHTFYRSLLPSFQLHVLLKKPLSTSYSQAARQIFQALQRGRFYNAVDSAAQAEGFEFWAEKGTHQIHMGEETVLDSPVTLHVRSAFPFAREIRLIHNGKIIAVSEDGKLTHDSQGPGFYRTEVYLKTRTPLAKDIPWILSNPVYLKEEDR